MKSLNLNCTIIAPDTEPSKSKYRELVASNQFGFVEWLREFPDEGSLLRMLRLNAMDLLVLDASNLPAALRTVELVRRHAAGLELLVICDPDVKHLSALMRAGVWNYIESDCGGEELLKAVESMVTRLQERPARVNNGGNLISFLPAKAGSGASTIAANSAYAASFAPDKRVLLSDFDRCSGIQSFLFKVSPENSLQDALGLAAQMDGELWSRLRSQRNQLDILPVNLQSTTEHLPEHTRHLLAFFRRAYDLVCIDLPSVIDPHAVEVLLESKRVYVVCTQELASLHLALNRVSRLQRLGLEKTIRILVNRYNPAHVMNPERIAGLVGAPVELVIPNNYSLATLSSEQGSLVDPKTPLGKSYRRLAQNMLDDRIEIARTKKSFLEQLYQPFLKSRDQGAA